MLTLWLVTLMQDTTLRAPEHLWPTTVAGWVGLLLGFAAMVGVIYGYAKGLAHLNGLGERVKALELGGERRETRLTSVEVVVRDHEKEAHRISTELGKIQAWQESSREALQNMKEEIIGFVSERLSKIDGSIHDLDKQIALVQKDVGTLTRDSDRREGR